MTYTAVYSRLRRKKTKVGKAKIETIEGWLNANTEKNHPSAEGDYWQYCLGQNKIKAIEYAARFNKEALPFSVAPKAEQKGARLLSIIRSLETTAGIKYTDDEIKYNFELWFGIDEGGRIFRGLGG